MRRGIFQRNQNGNSSEYHTDEKLLRKSSSGRTLLSCTYFPNGSLASLTDASGKPVYYEYDWRGKLSGVKDENGNMLAQYTHTPGGKLKEIRHGNGMHTQYEYDTDGNIIHLRLERPDGTALSDWQYEYDLNGNRTLKAGSFADAGDKLCGTVIRYQYDRMDRLTEESHNGEAVGYSYDLCGNRIKKVDENGSEVYTYNVKNQLASRKSEKAETYYRYDQQGNVLEATGTEGGTYYSYNAFNQQTKVRKSDGGCLESQYDAEYLRAGTVENGKECSFLYYNGELLAELGQNQETAGRYILGYGVVAGWNHKNEGYHFYHLDEQNSTAYITGMEGGIENRYQYDAFGVITDRQEGFDNRILYTGQQYDPITEQYYLRARYYNPAVGRFLQEDVYRGDGLNLYAYCKNNPVIYYDPSGYAETEFGYRPEYGDLPENFTWQDWQRATYGSNTKKAEAYYKETGKTPGFSARDAYMGPTPSNDKKIREDIAKEMESWGYIQRDSKGNVTKFKSLSDDKWYDISMADMSHKNATFEQQLKDKVHIEQTGHMDAVEYWNKIGKYTGARSDEVRKYMTTADNYYFELASHNRSDGGKDHNGNRITYDAPEPNGKPETEGASDCKS